MMSAHDQGKGQVKRFIRQLYYRSAWFLAKIIQWLPYSLSIRLGGCLGLCAYYTVAEARRLTEENLRAAFPEKDINELRGIARNVFINQGKNLFELFSFPKLSPRDFERWVTLQNKEGLSRAMEKGNGVLIASAHCGNWEMMGAALSLNGFPINVIARKIYIDGLNRMLVDFRRSKGLNVILRSEKESAREILRSLRHNEAIGILIDQDTAVPGVFVHFFSRPAWTPSGLAALALKTGASVVLALDIRHGDDTHTVVIDGPLDLTATGDREGDILENTQRITRMIEDHIRRYPAQWVWLHARWKTKPPCPVNDPRGDG